MISPPFLQPTLASPKVLPCTAPHFPVLLLSFPASSFSSQPTTSTRVNTEICAAVMLGYVCHIEDPVTVYFLQRVGAQAAKLGGKDRACYQVYPVQGLLLFSSERFSRSEQGS
jgi:hypothetical protein